MKLSAKFTAKATIAALALTASAAAMAPAAHAQRLLPPGPGATSLDYQCFQIQTDYVDGVAEFKTAYANNDQAAMDAAGKKLRGAEDNWKAICEGVYGSLYIANDATIKGETGLGGSQSTPPKATAAPRPGQDSRNGVQ